MINFRELVKNGVHFGHQTSRWCPKMRPYIWGIKNKTHLIDVAKTAVQAEKAKIFLEDIASQGKLILWVGTKKAAQDSVKKLAVEIQMPFVTHRWVGGTLSNYSQVKKSVTKLLHFEDVLSKSENSSLIGYTKKELNVLQKMVARLERSVGGLRKLVWPIGAIVVVDVLKEASAIQEAQQMGVPVVGIVDTNSDPSFVDYVIPANDDAPQSITILLDYLAEGVRSGLQAASAKGVSTGEIKLTDDLKDLPADALALLDEEDVKSAESGKKKIVRKPLSVGAKGSNIRGVKKSDE
jgi:small subunit ribosomal protein S2